MADPTGCCGPDPAAIDALPDAPPACTAEDPTLGFRTLRKALGRLAPYVKLHNRGVIRARTDNSSEGLDVILYGDTDGSSDLKASACTTYINPIRRIIDDKGVRSLGGLPTPLTAKVCESTTGCAQLIAGQDKDTVWPESNSNCQQRVSVTIENASCWPMRVTPTVTIKEVSLGTGPVVHRLRPAWGGTFLPSVNIVGGSSDDAFPNIASTSLTFDDIIVEAGKSQTFSCYAEIKFTANHGANVQVNMGELRVCLDGRSEITATTVAALTV